MSRPIPRFIFALAPPLCLVLIGLGLLFGSMRASGAAAAPLLNVADSYRYCYNWDFLNNTGQDADGLRVRLNNIANVSAVYTGTLNPFGAPDATSGYDPVAKVYNLSFSNGVAYNGDRVHIGICTDQPALGLAPMLPALPAFAWSLQSQPLQPAPLFTGIAWSWQPNNLRLDVRNGQGVTLTLEALVLLDPGVMLSLDDLNADTIASLPAAAILVDDPVAIAPNGSRAFDVASPVTVPNHPYVLEAILSTEDDPGNTIHVYDQALYPPAASLYFPILFKH